MGVLTLLFIFLTQVTAVLNEQNLDNTVHVLKAELEKTYKEETEMMARYDSLNVKQHKEALKTIQESEKIALMLYSQKQDYIFDMAYACHEATMQYHNFKKERMPFDISIKKLDNEIKRYTLLIESLESISPRKRKFNIDSLKTAKMKEDSIKKAVEQATAAYEAQKYGKQPTDTTVKGMGINIFGKQLGGDTSSTSAEEIKKAMEAKQDSFMLEKAREIAKEVSDSVPNINDTFKIPSMPKSVSRIFMTQLKDFRLSEESQIERDSCVALSKKILANLISVRDHIIKDKKLYEHVEDRLKSVNDYALGRYEAIQQSIFTNGGNNYLSVIRNFKSYSSNAYHDIKDKYTSNSEDSDWRGTTIIGLVLSVFGIVLLAAGIAIFFLKQYGKRKKLKTEFIPYYAISLTCFLFTILCTLPQIFASQNFLAMACSRLIEYVLLIAAITLSLVYRTKGDQIKSAFSCYLPILMMGLVIIIFRILFVPNNLVVILFPPMLILFTIWGFRSVQKHHSNVPKYDEIYAWISLTIMTVACVMAWLGYALLAVEVFIWWLVQLTCVQALTFASEYMKAFEKDKVAKHILNKNGIFESSMTKEEYNNILNKKIIELQTNQGDNITYTWFLDLVTMCLIPVAAVLSFLLCIYIATDIFDLTAMCKDIFFTNFLDIEDLCQLSLFKLVVVLEFYFIFKFVSYLFRSVYKHWKLKNKQVHEIERSNITLVNNLISIVVWSIYFIFILFLLQVPKSGISIVTAGLATGLGFAMRDMINNFFYGITLMTGRVRVGDFIECDRVRGKVESITYQSTQLITLDGCVVAFLNSTLFTKTFKNLTRNHGYELVKLPVGVAYGTDVEKVRKILEEKLSLLKTEKTGVKPNVDPNKQISVYFNDFGDSSVNLYAVMWILVENKFVIVSRAKELIYNALNENDIVIPFPQRDVHIIPTPSK